eukprot:7235260-Alexandrium_andersonii.AAC.1
MTPGSQAGLAGLAYPTTPASHQPRSRPFKSCPSLRRLVRRLPQQPTRLRRATKRRLASTGRTG